MKTTRSSQFFHDTSKPRRTAFTLTELLVVVAIFAVLLSLALPGFAGAKGRSRLAQCGGNLKEFTMVLELYGNDNNNNLPIISSIGGGSWPWDISPNIFTNLMKYGATREMVYCPANSDQNNDAFWFYGGGTIHTIGYVMTMPNSASLLFTNINLSLIPKAIPFGPIIMPPAAASKRVLIADATISQPEENNTNNRSANTYTGILGGVALNGRPFPLRTSHLNGPLPAGGNLGMLDGHVEWRKFNAMIPRDDPSAPATTPEFWW